MGASHVVMCSLGPVLPLLLHGLRRLVRSPRRWSSTESGSSLHRALHHRQPGPDFRLQGVPDRHKLHPLHNQSEDPAVTVGLLTQVTQIILCIAAICLMFAARRLFVDAECAARLVRSLSTVALPR